MPLRAGAVADTQRRDAKGGETQIADAAAGNARAADTATDAAAALAEALRVLGGDAGGQTPRVRVAKAAPGFARCADLEDRRYPLMQAVSRIDEDLFRPRHFRPLPAGAPVVTDERHAVAIETCRARLVMVAVVFAVVFLVVALRLLTMPLLLGGSARSARRRGSARPDRRRRRAPISSIATASCWRRRSSTPSLYADTRHIPDAREATRAILSVLPQLNQAEVYAKLTSGKSFVFIKRRLTPTQQYQINRLGIPGLQFVNEERRVYPYGDLASHVVGFCGIDNNGLAGIERALDDDGQKQREAAATVARRPRAIHPARRADQGHQRFQRQGRRRHRHGRQYRRDHRDGVAARFRPEPSRPRRRRSCSPAEAKDRVFNKITLGAYELGSVFKTFNTAMALDAGTATMTKQYDAIHNIKIGRFTITDYHGKHRYLSVPEIYMYSSNLGSARMALEAGRRAAAQFSRAVSGC